MYVGLNEKMTDQECSDDGPMFNGSLYFALSDSTFMKDTNLPVLEENSCKPHYVRFEIDVEEGNIDVALNRQEKGERMTTNNDRVKRGGLFITVTTGRKAQTLRILQSNASDKPEYFGKYMAS
jgi:hypothetical protein